jgi:membrane peptidoglycan carboxypeptidase
MGTDDDRRLDDELRRRARKASEQHRGSITPDDTDQALAAVRSGHGGEPRQDAVGLKRTGWIVAAAAATIAIVVAGVAWWPAVESDDRLTSVSESGADDDAGITTEGVDESQLPTTPPPVILPAAASTTTVVVDLPSVALDTEGNEIATFRLMNGRTVIESESTAFTETLLDDLLNRSTILGDTISERADEVFKGGLRIGTTLDPKLQRAAEQARNELPENEAGIDAAIVSIETSTGAIRAIVSGDESVPDDSRINTAITPRPTGSAVETFILAAALQAGAQPDDLIDGRRGCVLPGPWTDPEFPTVEEPYFQINGGVAGFVGPLRDMVAASVRCGAARLSHVVGLERVVHTMYRLAESPYLFEGQSPNLREPIEPVTDLASGINPMSPLDMASGMQTIANVGVHHLPYFIEFVEDAGGARRYIHERAPTTVLDPDVALDAVDVLRGTITFGTGRRHPLADGRPAIGKTGTVPDNTDAWFVGATPQLTTAVWVGDPVGSTPMINFPEFRAVDVYKVQGGQFPAQIWKAFTDAALADEPIQDWDSPSPPERPNVRLVLPGYECVFFDAGESVPLGPDEIGTSIPPGDTDPTSLLPSVAPGVLIEGCN